MRVVRAREPAKTWSLLGDVRNKPSEYEIVTAKLHYHYRHQPAPFELDPNTPINTWYHRYREGSALQADSWEGFRDPHQLTYRAYVEQQAARESYLDNLVDEFERHNHDASLKREWVDELDRLYLPTRFPIHAFQMTALYVGQMAPSSFITNAAYFQAADELRRIQRVAYRAKSLALEHHADLGSSASTRRRWEEDAVWQLLRETVEKMLIVFDWGEAFAVLNLVVKPIFDAVFNEHVAELARSNDDALLALILDDFVLDSQRSHDWTVALVQYAVEQRPANAGLLRNWVDQWQPLAYSAMERIVELCGQAPCAALPHAVLERMRVAHHAFLHRCGLSAQLEQVNKVHDQEATPMATEMRESGIDVIGDMATWGTHFCLFYETKEDRRDAMTSFCKAGLENDEFCLWVVAAEPLTIEEATAALKQAVPNFDSYVADSRIEIVSANDFFLQGGKFDRKRVKDALFAKLASVSRKGFTGVRLTGDTSWVTKNDWIPFCELEEGINEVIGNLPLAVLCAYSLASCGPYEILDAVRTHQFALVRRQEKWVVIETAGLKRAKAEINQLNDELEQRVVERTSELMKTSEALRATEAELTRVSRLTTMGELTASIAHEVNQPLTAISNNSSACLRLHANHNLDPEVLHRALEEIVADSTRASAVISRIRAFIKKKPAEKTLVNINDVIQEVLAIAGLELQKNKILVEQQLTRALPLVPADRVQLQQVVLNLIMNGIEAMTTVTDRPRVLRVQSRINECGDVLVTIHDSGTGLGSEADLFTPFFTTKPHGMGMGLPISRSVIEGHGGHLWAEPNISNGAVFSFTVPVADGSSS
jgi:signal transduction histidine kinase